MVSGELILKKVAVANDDMKWHWKYNLTWNAYDLIERKAIVGT